MTADTCVILIGGSSHSGKSTLAAKLGATPGWTHISTDSLARHPWPTPGHTVKPHVAAHYRDLSVDALIEDVLAHYNRLWPDIEALVGTYASAPDKGNLVLEGSALWPDNVATLTLASVKAVWLTGSDDLFETRIKASSDYETCNSEARYLVDKFLARTLRYNTLMTEAVDRIGLTSLDAAQAANLKTMEQLP